MLIKLFKYEFKATYKFFLFAFALIIGLSVLMFITGGFGGNSFGSDLTSAYGSTVAASILYMFLLLVYIVVCAAAAMAIIIYAIIRFYQSMLGSEGYITHTLPVKTESLIIVKNITMTVWMFLTAAVILACSFVLFRASLPGLTLTTYNLPEIRNILSQISKTEIITAAVLITVNFFALFSRVLMTVYASMAVGYSNNTSRKLKSFLVYLILQYLSQLVSGILGSLLRFDKLLPASAPSAAALNISLTVSLIITLAITAALFFMTRYFLKYRLNLQ